MDANKDVQLPSVDVAPASDLTPAGEFIKSVLPDSAVGREGLKDVANVAEIKRVSIVEQSNLPITSSRELEACQIGASTKWNNLWGEYGTVIKIGPDFDKADSENERMQASIVRNVLLMRLFDVESEQDNSKGLGALMAISKDKLPIIRWADSEGKMQFVENFFEYCKTTALKRDVVAKALQNAEDISSIVICEGLIIESLFDRFASDFDRFEMYFGHDYPNYIGELKRIIPYFSDKNSVKISDLGYSLYSEVGSESFADERGKLGIDKKVIELCLFQNPPVAPIQKDLVAEVVLSLLKKNGEPSRYEMVRNQNMQTAFQHAMEIAGSGVDLTVDSARRLHEDLMENISDDGGEWRTERIMNKDVLSVSKIDEKMKLQIDEINGLKPADQDQAAQVAAKIVANVHYIHPTWRGARRLGWLLANVALKKMGQDSFILPLGKDVEGDHAAMLDAQAGDYGKYAKLILDNQAPENEILKKIGKEAE